MKICRGLSERKLPLSLLVFLALGLCLFVPSRTPAQVAGATLSGTITDPSGSAIPNAEVTVRDTGKGTVTKGTANSDGYYTVVNLQPGNYEVTVAAPGFETQLMSNIVLAVGARQTLPVSMKIGSSAQTVTVTEAAPIVQLASSEISGEVNSTTVRELPLNGRDWTQLATLQPGVLSDASLQPSASGTNGLGGFARGQRGFGLQLAINGSRPEQNNYRIDGISVNDYANGGPGTALGATMGVDAVQEFSVLTSNYSAEYGRTSGGVVNALTKSGTNQFHGDVFEFLRNSAMDAHNALDRPNTRIPLFHRNQFGGAAGAPIRKDKTFVFGTYEGFRQGKGVTASPIVPTQDARNGLLTFPAGTTFPTDPNGLHNCVAVSTTQCQMSVDPLVVPYLALWPLPNDGITTPRNSGTYTNIGAQTFSEDFVSVRVDHRISDKDNIYATYQYDRSTFTGPDSLNDVLNGSFTHRQFLALQESHVFSSNFVNSVRVGFNRNRVLVGASQSALNPGAGDPALGLTTGRFAPVIQPTDFANFTGGVDSNTHSAPLINSFQEYDDASLTKGNHTLKFGFGVERIQTNITSFPPGGTYKFGSLYGFLSNQPTTLVNPPPTGPSPGYAYRQTIIGAYIQDDFRWKPHFTFNIGLRYEVATVPNEHYGKQVTLNSLTDPTIVPGRAYFSNPTLRNFEPRVGFAWDPFRDGKSSVRAGFGMYDVLPLPYFFYTGAGGPPFTPGVGQPTILTEGSFPFIAYQSAVVSTKLSNMFIEPNPKRNYVLQWNLSLQHQFSSNLVATLTYSGTRGIHQALHGDDFNEVIPTLTSAGLLWPCGPNGTVGVTCAVGFSPTGTQSTPIPSAVVNPLKGRMIGLLFNSNSFYHGLAAGITKTMSHGLQFQGSYTWSKCIDEGSASKFGDEFGNGVVGLPFFNGFVRRGLCDYNVTQNMVANYSWSIPTPKSFEGPLAYVSGGWQLGGIFSVHTGTPFTPLVGGDPLGEKNTQNFDVPSLVPGCGPLTNPGNIFYINTKCFTPPTFASAAPGQCAAFKSVPGTCANLLGNVGRNSLVGPGFWNFDFSVFKNNPVRKISETFNVQFRAELFNVFNHPNFSSPINNSTLFNASGIATAANTAGKIDQTANDPRDVQFAIKVIW